MPEVPPPVRQIRRVSGGLLIIDIIAVTLAWIVGAYALSQQQHALAAGLLGGGAVALVIGVILYSQLELIHQSVIIAFRSYDALLEMLDLLRRQEGHARAIADNSSLSDWAKSIVYRDKDYAFLRDTISAAIVRQDWAAAEHLITDVGEKFGYEEQVADLRSMLEQARNATREEKIASAIERFEMLCGAQKWDQAHQDAERLRSLYPGEPRVEALPQELAARRQKHKRELLQDYDEAVRAQDVDRAHDLLLELDQYLRPNEAAALKESARGVFKAKLLQMGVEFSLAVTDRKFAHAISVGRALMREFPNSRYAREIGEMMPALRRRVAEEARQNAAKRNGG